MSLRARRQDPGMATRKFTTALAEMADVDNAVVTRRRLLADQHRVGDIYDALDRRLLVQVFRGVYLIGRSTLTQPALRRAATLHAEPSMLLGRSAAEHRELLDERIGVVTVGTTRPKMAKSAKTFVPMEGPQGRPGLALFRPTNSVEPDNIYGIPTSPVPRMLIDIAAAEKRSMLERVWKQADYRRILDLAAVDRALRATTREGAPLVRELLLKHPGRFALPAYYGSPSEVNFRQLVADAGLPDPEVNVPFAIDRHDYVADFFYRDLQLVIEVDDPSHRRPLSRQHDLIRDADFASIGILVVRFETERLKSDPRACMAQLAAIIEHRLRRAA